MGFLLITIIFISHQLSKRIEVIAHWVCEVRYVRENIAEVSQWSYISNSKAKL